MTVNRNHSAMSRRYRRHSVHEPVGSDPSREICDMELMRELILGVFLGESGTVFQTDPENDHRYKVREGLKIDPPTKTLALRLSNIGWLYNRIKRYRNHLSQNPSYGSVAIAFAAALDEAMIEYNRLITTIGQELHDMNDPEYVSGYRRRENDPEYVSSRRRENDPEYVSSRRREIEGMPFVSLSRIEVWTLDWFYKLKMLAVLIEKCKHKRGGGLVSVIYKESMHGDPMIRECMTRILVKVVEEVKKMLSRWIFHGQIEDPYKEFFITNTSQSQLVTGSTARSAGQSLSGQSLSGHSPTGDASAWLEKYTINQDMLPGFIPQDQARKILSTGTSVNLLLQSTPQGKSLNLLLQSMPQEKSLQSTPQEKSLQSTPQEKSLNLDSSPRPDSEDQRVELIPGYRRLEDAFEKTDSEVLFQDMFNLTCDDGNNNSNNSNSSGSSGSSVQCSFKEVLNKAHLETSLRAKKVLFEEHKLMDHLGGIRCFLLLGQGDFIRHFMERLVRVLNRPACLIKTHSVTEILSASIHATNAKFLDEEVLKRIDSIFLDTSGQGEERILLDMDQTRGWDIFTLTYRTKGAISSILTNSCMQRYSILFKHLWRSKRMEIILTDLWIKYRSTSPRLRLFPHDPTLRNKLKTMYHQNSLLIHEMNHFIQQMSYYIGFEVVECSWEEFVQRLNASSDIDSLVQAHKWFLNNVSTMSMLEPPSNPLFLQLRAVYDSITDYQTELQSFEEKLSLEVKAREEYKKKREGSSCLDTTGPGGQCPGTTGLGGQGGKTMVQEEEERKELKRRERFESKVVETFKVQMYIKSAQYQEMVQSFLILLAEHPDVNMKLLSTRIDFNKYYARSNKSLETSFHFSQRLSLDGSFK